MSRTTLKPKKYYDWQDIKKRFGFNDIHDLFGTKVDMANGILKTVYEPYLKDGFDATDHKIYFNQKRVFDELGECEIKIWW